MRTAVYLLGLLLVLVAIWMLFTQTGLSAIIPIGLLAIALLLVLGFGVMRAAHTVDDHPIEGREVVETRQQVGDTEVRRSKLR